MLGRGLNPCPIQKKRPEFRSETKPLPVPPSEGVSLFVVSVMGQGLKGLLKNSIGPPKAGPMDDKPLLPIGAGIHPAPKYGFFNKPLPQPEINLLENSHMNS
jgi:hypothetical protein